MSLECVTWVVMDYKLEICLHCIVCNLNLNLTQEHLTCPLKFSLLPPLPPWVFPSHNGQNHSFAFVVTLLCPYQRSLVAYESLIHFPAHKLYSFIYSFNLFNYCLNLLFLREKKHTLTLQWAKIIPYEKTRLFPDHELLLL